MPRTPAKIMEALARGHSSMRGEYEIDDLRRDWESSKGAAKPFMDFIPIRLVTIIENSVREVVPGRLTTASRIPPAAYR
jgi:hypothetical protein